MTGKDILYSRGGGRWRGDEGSYTKIRISLEDLNRMIRASGFTPGFSEARDVISIIATKK